MPQTKSCSRCGVGFTCGAAEDQAPCWCAQLPRVMPLDFTRDCLCPACLIAEIERRLGAPFRPKEAIQPNDDRPTTGQGQAAGS